MGAVAYMSLGANVTRRKGANEFRTPITGTAWHARFVGLDCAKQRPGGVTSRACVGAGTHTHTHTETVAHRLSPSQPLRDVTVVMPPARTPSLHPAPVTCGSRAASTRAPETRDPTTAPDHPHLVETRSRLHCRSQVNHDTLMQQLVARCHRSTRSRRLSTLVGPAHAARRVPPQSG